MQHSIGAMYLMGEAIAQLRQHSYEISEQEAEAVRACILLHDIGHGPFSHALENSLVQGVGHEEISLMLMHRLNAEFEGKLDLAIQIFTNTYPKKCLHQLVSGQLDMDRLDYLSRDSFFSGVSEGVIGAARIIKMLNVYNDSLVVDAKGIYSIEKFLVARRLMYWQVYLHKTSVAAEKMLVNILNRAKYLAHRGEDLFASPALHYFLYNKNDSSTFKVADSPLDFFVQLDDSDVICAIKVWASHPDKVLSVLCRDFASRRLFKGEIGQQKTDMLLYKKKLSEYVEHFNFTEEDANYFLGDEMVTTDTYSVNDEQINILFKYGTVKDVTEVSDMLNLDVLTKKVQKHFFCYYKI